ncbi:MAG: SlyX family protein [Lautropia sp.]|nr:SlyX family protein [Lautropia sp.]
MDESNSVERRFTDLEVKASFAEDLLDQLNQTVYRQQQQIEQLARELAELRQRIPDEERNLPAPGDEFPPHY